MGQNFVEYTSVLFNRLFDQQFELNFKPLEHLSIVQDDGHTV